MYKMGCCKLAAECHTYFFLKFKAKTKRQSKAYAIPKEANPISTKNKVLSIVR